MRTSLILVLLAGCVNRAGFMLASLFFLLLTACPSSMPRPHGLLGAVPSTEPSMLCIGSVNHGCRSAGDVVRRMQDTSIQLVQAAPAPRGAQGATVVTLRGSDGVIFDAKWRALQTRSRFNDPIAELAAFRLQESLLEPVDFVVTPTAAACIDHSAYRALRHNIEFDMAYPCVPGVLSFWLQRAQSLTTARQHGLVPVPGEERNHGDPWLYEPGRFRSDASYRRNVAHLNVLAFLMAHGDAHEGQFVVTGPPTHVFMVDNSVAFDMGHRDAMNERQDLSRWLVPSIPRETAERLRAFAESEMLSLRVLATLAPDRGHMSARESAPFGSSGERVRRDGERLQLGLTDDEVEGVRVRAQELLRRIQTGLVTLF